MKSLFSHKSSIPFFLAFLFLVQSVGFIAYFHLEKRAIHKAIKLKLKQGVPEDQLIDFVFNDQEIKQLIWKKKNEFVYKDQFYDIVRTRKSADGKTHFSCVSDNQETELFKQMNQYITKNLADPDSDNPVSSLFEIVQTPFILPNQPSIFEKNRPISENIHHNFHYRPFETEWIKNTIFQPPIV